MDKKFAHKIFEGFSIQRWNDLIRPFDMVEMDKAAEKMVLAYIIGKFEENKGKKIDWIWIIYASLFDLLKKIALCDIKAPIQQILKKDHQIGGLLSCKSIPLQLMLVAFSRRLLFLIYL